MKKTLLLSLVLVAAGIFFSGCSKLSTLDSRLDEIEGRLSKFEICQSLNENLQSMQIVIQAIQQGDYITSITAVKRDGKEIGYILELSKAGKITVLNIDMLDYNAPVFKIEDGYWYISYDKGSTWEKAGRATGEDASPILKKIAVTDDSVCFTIQDGTTYTLPRFLEDSSNLPTGIILTTKSIDYVNVGDTVEIKIIVNPSNFAITKEKLTLMANHHLYTKYDIETDPQTHGNIETPFDESARCELSIESLRKDPSYEGAYTLSVAIGGEGNFFDDVDIYLLYGDQARNGKTHYVCSSSSVSTNVIPSLKNAFSFEMPNQTYYKYKEDQYRIIPDGIKTQYMGMWMNRYKDIYGVNKIYDRSLISSVRLEHGDADACCVLNENHFKSSGILEIAIMEDDPHWVTAIEENKQKGIAYASYPKGYGITFTRSQKESVTYSIEDSKLFFNAYFTQEQTVDLDNLAKDMRVSFDISKELEESGNDGSFDSLRNISCAKGHGTTNSVALDIISKEKIDMVFMNLKKIKELGEISCYYWNSYSFGGIQQDNGNFISDDEQRYLTFFCVELTTKLNE